MDSQDDDDLGEKIISQESNKSQSGKNLFNLLLEIETRLRREGRDDSKAQSQKRKPAAT